MTVKQNPRHRYKNERAALVASAAIMITFFLFVAIATKGSLVYYTMPHIVLGLTTVVALLFLASMPRLLLRIFVAFAIIGAVSAIGVTMIYLPYYGQYLNYITSAS